MAFFDFQSKSVRTSVVQSKFARNATGEILRSLSIPVLYDWESYKDTAHLLFRCCCVRNRADRNITRSEPILTGRGSASGESGLRACCIAARPERVDLYLLEHRNTAR